MKESLRSLSAAEASKKLEIPRESATLIVVRHAQGAHNVDPSVVNPDLTSLGVQQARALGFFFREQGVHFDAAYGSGRPRTDQTGRNILQSMDLPLVITANNSLRELNNGIYAHIHGKHTGEVSKRLSEHLRQLPDAERWEHMPTAVVGVSLEKYETERQAANRFEAALAEIAAAHPGETVLVVSHAMVMESYLASLKERERINNRDEHKESVFKGLHVKNTGYFEIESDMSQSSNTFHLVDTHLKGLDDSIFQALLSRYPAISA